MSLTKNQTRRRWRSGRFGKPKTVQLDKTMRNKTLSIGKLMSLTFAGLALAAASILLTPTANAQFYPVTITGSVSGPNGDTFVPRAHVGDTVDVDIAIWNLDVNSTAPPTLNIARVDGSSVKVSWPASAQAFRL